VCGNRRERERTPSAMASAGGIIVSVE